MSSEFRSGFHRKAFGDPLPISKSLLRVADKPITWIFRHWKNHIKLDDHNTVMESVFPVGIYFTPSFAQLEAYFRRVEKMNPELAKRIDESQTYQRARNRVKWGIYSNRSTDKWTRAQWMDLDHSSRALSAKEVAALSLYNDGCLGVSSGMRGMDFTGFSFDIRDVDEVKPAMLTQVASLFDTTKHNSPILDDPEATTIGEVLHAVSRFPRALSCRTFRSTEGWNNSITKKPAPLINLDLMLGHGRKELHPLAGEAWVSYAALVSHIPYVHYRLGVDDLIEVIKRYIATGMTPEQLQPYVTIPGIEPDDIRLAFGNGVRPDMLSAVRH